jgi:hypothetical protein
MRSRWFDALWLLVFGLASSAWCMTAAAELGPTFDEPLYLNAGLASWRTGSNKLLMSAGTMPLPVDVQTLPIYLWELHRGSAFHAYRDIDQILPVARAANLTFWWLVLVYAMRLGRTWGGRWGGRIATALIACDPNFLGHAALATTDIALLAAMLALVYHSYHGQGQGWSRRVLVPGLCFGFATLAKASGMVFGMQVMLVLGLCHLARTGTLAPPAGTSYFKTIVHLWHASFQLRKDLVWIGLIGFTIVFAYTGSDWGTEWTFIDWAEKLPEGTLRSLMVPASHNLAIFPNAGEALLQQVKHNLRGHGAFILGQWHEKAYWAYFPIALSIKTPAPVLALLLAVVMIRPRALATPLAAIVLVLFLFSLNCRVQIGIRFLFTLIALLEIALAAAAARTWAEPDGGRYVPRWFVGCLLAIMAGTAAWVWPHGISFVNQLWGGMQGGYHRLSDSNYDWGQGLPELKEWNAANNGGEPVAVAYFGTDPAVLFPPFKAINLYYMLQAGTPQELRHVCGTRYLAVSTSVLYGAETNRGSHAAVLRHLRTLKPIGRTRTFLIFDVAR